MGFWRSLVPRYVESLGYTLTEELNRQLFVATFEQGAEILKRTFGIEKTAAEIVAETKALVVDYYANEAEPKEGASRLLDELEARNVISCVASLTPKPLIEAALSRLGWMSRFEFIITSDEVGSGKECPDIYFESAKRLGSRVDEALVFEDSPLAAVTAAGAGFTVVGIKEPCFEPRWGELENCCAFTVEHPGQSVEKLIDGGYLA